MDRDVEFTCIMQIRHRNVETFFRFVWDPGIALGQAISKEGNVPSLGLSEFWWRLSYYWGFVGQRGGLRPNPGLWDSFWQLHRSPSLVFGSYVYD